MNKKQILLLLSIISIGFFLNFYKLNELMMFIGDFGWFYLSAKEMIVTGSIPLVGIPSSHPWLEQGAMWTYMLAPALVLCNFNPICGGYLTAGIGTFSILLLFYFTKELFNIRVAFVTAFLYATSPLIIIHTRMPYHTAPIPFFIILFMIFTLKWVKNDIKYFPLVLFCLGILYQLEIAAFVMVGVVCVILIYGIIKKMKYAVKLLNIKIILLSLLSFTISFLPIIIYDIFNNFPHTIKFLAWIGYRILLFVGILNNSASSSSSLYDIGSFLGTMIQRILFLPSEIVANLLLGVVLVIFLYVLYREFKKKKRNMNVFFLFIFFFIPLLGFLINKTPSEAYLPILFPQIILIVSWFFMYSTKKIPTLIIYFVIGLIGFLNAFNLIQQNYLMGVNNYGLTFTERLNIVNQVLTQTEGIEYNISGNGPGSEFESYTMNYEYLLWWKGHSPSDIKVNNTIIINDSLNSFYIEK